MNYPGRTIFAIALIGMLIFGSIVQFLIIPEAEKLEANVAERYAPVFGE